MAALSNLQLRLITGFSGSAIIAASLYYSAWGYFAIFFIITTSCLYEFYSLVRKNELAKPDLFFGLTIGVFNYIAGFLICQFEVPAWVLILNFPLVSLLFIRALYTKRQAPFTDISFTLLGILYASIPLSMMTMAAFIEGSYSWQMVIGILVLLWASDTGAYAAGRTLGKHPLFPRISPKKTWEGFFGGLVLSLVFAALFAQYFTAIDPWKWYIMSTIIVVFGSLGDLVESMFKRSIEIKDSGSIIPGHGGFLDRFDGLLIALPIVVAFLIISAQF